MQDKLHDLSYQLSGANGLIYLWIISGVAVVIALIILFDPFKRRHKEHHYPGISRRPSFWSNPFGFLFRRRRRHYRDADDEPEQRPRPRPEDRG